MATGQTKLANLINPQVMADMIAAELPQKIKMSPFAVVDTTLQGVAGNTITIPKFAYIGEADDVAEGIAAGTTVLTATTSQATVKKAVKAVELTDEAMLSGYGDPVGEATRQLTLSLADKIDSDCMTAAVGASKVADKSTAVISYNSIVDAVDLFEDEAKTTFKSITEIFATMSEKMQQLNGKIEFEPGKPFEYKGDLKVALQMDSSFKFIIFF